jgi:RecA-family ATPase
MSATPISDVFRDQCATHAILVRNGEEDLHEAVDHLQNDAVGYGLVDELGQDWVQQTIAEAFQDQDRNPTLRSSNGFDKTEQEIIDGWDRKEREAEHKRAEAERKNIKANNSAISETELICTANVQMRKIDWLWSNHLARGKMTMLSGPSELGKSQISIDFASRLSSGGAWPDGDEAPLGSVIILSSEDGIADTVVPRLAAAEAKLERVHCLGFVQKNDGTRHTFSLQADLQQLGEKIRQIGDVVLVIIDPVTSYMGHKIDSHQTANVRAVLEPLARFAEEHWVAVLLISHPQKATATKALNAVTGSAAFVHAPRMSFICITDPDDKTRTLFLAGKNNIGRKAEGIAYRIEQCLVGPDQSVLASRICWDHTPVRISADEALRREAENSKGGAMAEAKEFLRDNLEAPMPASDLEGKAEAHGISKATLRRARKALKVQAKKDGYQGAWRLHLAAREGDDR